MDLYVFLVTTIKFKISGVYLYEDERLDPDIEEFILKLYSSTGEWMNGALSLESEGMSAYFTSTR